ncbi:hypothetical protein HRG_000237 [Hirsutella rhossiliensis]|uniref:Uncharacterized protein n=1 Tax=Hirsutella rhossiliensis TaxID=111463 RepID=A0A9P8SN79_9HYPO|nr:uncharacterized protein HRG_00237 [Hirsutella rhossiliensis]KAH0967595.1 hypothetical protein HRG_00237 [Hirsutella rhossiliensis]
MKDAKKRNPKFNYDKAAAAHTSIEVSRLKLCLADAKDEPDDPTDLKYINEFFTEQRLPTNVGWTPSPRVKTVQDVLKYAVEGQAASTKLQDANNGKVITTSK